MKLIRFGLKKNEKPGIIDTKGIIRDCSAHFKDWNHNFFQYDGLDSLKKINVDKLPIIDKGIRLGSPIHRPGKIVCIGLNYQDHVKETNMICPKEPTIFLKATNTIIGPNDNIQIPKKSIKTDWEIELGIIIKKDCKYLNSEIESKDYIAGYTISNDVSERDFQKNRGGQWTKGKSCDTFNPTGPYLLTTDEISDVNNLNMNLTVNGTTRQHSNTKNMIFNPYYIVHYLSQFMTLEAGDLISTGTPSGVGMGMTPPQFLKAGDTVELTIDKLGTQTQKCV